MKQYVKYLCQRSLCSKVIRTQTYPTEFSTWTTRWSVKCEQGATRIGHVSLYQMA